MEQQYKEKTRALNLRAAEMMDQGMELVDLFVNRNYLIDLNRCQPIPLESSQKSFSYLSLFEIGKIVCDPDENINDKLVSVYSALSNFGSSALMVLFGDDKGVKFYLGTRDAEQPNVAKDILQKSLRGNFPGIQIREQSSAQVARLLEGHIPDKYSNMAVSAVSIVPSPRDEDKERFVQGLEKFIDSMAGECYTAVFVSAPLGKAELERKKRGYEELYSTLSQFAQANLTYSENDSESVAEAISDSFSTAVNTGISDTTGTSYGENDTVSKGRSSGHSMSFFGVGSNSGKNRSTSKSTSTGSSDSHTDTRGETETKGRTTSNTATTTIGSTSTIAITRQNKTVQVLLAKIDEQMERIRHCESYGLWNSACYFIAPNPETSIVAANTFKAIVAGEKTSVENSFINVWDNSFEAADKVLPVLDYLRYGIHPRFQYTPPNGAKWYQPQTVTPASLISGLELPILLGFPRKSVSGVTSIACAEFGRNVFAKGQTKSYRSVDLGAICHMGETFGGNRVRLDLESFSSHCFITGSTGSGKSNTTYKIIDELTASRNNIKFLVVEPAKGEYKLEFGGMPGIHIFTTNPKYYNMLQINPFAFPEEVHVLEHLDRLIEIFSACWPLYAAMPALLKAAFEQAYIAHGWDLNYSLRIDRGNGMFPSFLDIVEILPELLEQSEFSAQTKGDYIGSLVTRVESLTNGLLGQIFSANAIEDRILFDENVIVDLSRVGSAETKALLMGVLVLKLSEYRQSTAAGTNCPLKHITILEEAHNLLKRTSTEQGQESANVQGKSVEMIGNSIAEMRTYGEGFIIVDQSPTAVDISAIKNTNTKIIMRLPEYEDCVTAGRSIGLNEQQIVELSRLDKGVAAVYQNSWLEAVLVSIDKSSGRFACKTAPVNDPKARKALVGALLTELVAQDASGDFDLSWFSPILDSSSAPEYFKDTCRRQLAAYQKEWKTPRKHAAFFALIFGLLDCGNLFRIYEDKLPPAIREKAEITKEVRDCCEGWCGCIRDGMDWYADFSDKKVKEITFKGILLHKIALEKHDMRYKLVLHTL